MYRLLGILVCTTFLDDDTMRNSKVGLSTIDNMFMCQRTDVLVFLISYCIPQQGEDLS